ncbi:HNH endonuclease [Priestia megaterium]
MGRKYTLEEVREEFNKYGCILLSKEYKNNVTPLEFLCSCGQQGKKSLNAFKSWGNKGCAKCGRKKQAEKLKLSYEEVKKVFEDANCVLLEDKYINNQTKMKYICNCGKESAIKFSSFKDGGRCKECGIEKVAASSRKYTIETVRIELEKFGYKFVDKKYKNTNTRFLCECPKGHRYRIRIIDFLDGRRCFECFKERNRGSNHHRWNPDLDEDYRMNNRKLIPGYPDWVQSVFERDGYECQCCSVKGGKLNAHHILNFSNHKELRLEISNGITLCKECHKKFHQTYGIKNNTKEQLDEFLRRYGKNEDNDSEQLTLF